jgi:hypothetical protein
MGFSQTILLILMAGCFHQGELANTITVKVGVLLMQEVDWPWDLRRVGPAIEVAKIAAKTKYDVELNYQYHAYLGQCPLEKSVGMLLLLFFNKIQEFFTLYFFFTIILYINTMFIFLITLNIYFKS